MAWLVRGPVVALTTPIFTRAESRLCGEAREAAQTYRATSGGIENPLGSRALYLGSCRARTALSNAEVRTTYQRRSTPTAWGIAEYNEKSLAGRLMLSAPIADDLGAHPAHVLVAGRLLW